MGLPPIQADSRANTQTPVVQTGSNTASASAGNAAVAAKAVTTKPTGKTSAAQDTEQRDKFVVSTAGKASSAASTVTDPQLLIDIKTYNSGQQTHIATNAVAFQNTYQTIGYFTEGKALLVRIVASGAKLPNVDQTVVRDLVFAMKSKGAIEAKLARISEQAYSSENQAEMDDLTKALHVMNDYIRYAVGHQNMLALSDNTVALARRALSELAEVGEKLVEVAMAKGYTIKSSDTLLKEIEEGVGTDFISSGVDEERTLDQLKKSFNGLTQTIIDDLRQNSDEQKRLDEGAFKKKMMGNKAELVRLEKLYTIKLTNKRLQQKLKAITIHLGYLLKHPESLTVARMESYRDEINRIKWQTMPNKSSQH